jgi:hypothetical protein
MMKNLIVRGVQNDIFDAAGNPIFFECLISYKQLHTAMTGDCMMHESNRFRENFYLEDLNIIQYFLERKLKSRLV